MSGYPTLLLFRAYLLRLLGEEDQVRVAIKAFNISDVPVLSYFLTESLSASNGTGKIILEQLWEFFQKNNEIEITKTHDPEIYLHSQARTFWVAEQLYFLADRFSEAGDTDTALDFWARSARGGVFSGLVSYTWVALETGAFDAGVALYEECIEIPCDPMYKLEKLNCTGIYLLNLLARDHDYASAIMSFNSLILEEGDDTTYVNHMSTAILELQHGDRARAIQIFKLIPSKVQIQLFEAYFEESANAEGWLSIWCALAIMAINELANE